MPSLRSDSLQKPFLQVSPTLLVLLLTASTAVYPAQQEDEGDELFQFPPNTPSRLVRGAIIAESLDRSDLAQGYLNDLVTRAPGTATLLELRSEFGIGQFLDLSANPNLAPAARDLLKLINEAVRRDAESAASVDRLIEQLGPDNAEAREAILRILAAGDAAAKPLLNSDPGTPQGQVASQILSRHARKFRFGLLSELETTDTSGLVRVLSLLATVRDEELARDLIPLQFHEDRQVAEAARTSIQTLTHYHPIECATPSDATELLIDEAINLISQTSERFPNEQNRRRDRELQAFIGDVESSHGAASLARAASLVSRALAIEPNSNRCLALQKVTDAASQAFPPSWPNVDIDTIAANMESASASTVDALALEIAIGTRSPSAILGLLSDSPVALAVLKDRPDLHRPLLLAGDSRVRLLSAGILKSLGVNDARISELISLCIECKVENEAVVIDSRRGEGLSAAAVLTTSPLQIASNSVRNRTGLPSTEDALAAELGLSMEQLQEARTTKDSLLTRAYAPRTTNSGKSGFIQATGQMNTELIAIHSNCLQWDAAGTIANLRADFRTKNTPVVIYGPERDESRTAILRSRFPGVWFVPAPLSELTFVDQLRIQKIPGPALTSAERESMRKFARSLSTQR